MTTAVRATPDAVAAAKLPRERSDQLDALADAACGALVAYRAAESDALEATERARALRDDALLELSEAGWSVRRIASELDLSPARVGQLLIKARERRATEWGEYRLTPDAVRADRLDSFHTARHAQVLREENYTSGGATERAAFYGRLDAPIVDEAEAPLTWKAFLQDAAGQ